jgi:hypothetical protein
MLEIQSVPPPRAVRRRIEFCGACAESCGVARSHAGFELSLIGTVSLIDLLRFSVMADDDGTADGQMSFWPSEKKRNCVKSTRHFRQATSLNSFHQ